MHDLNTNQDVSRIHRDPDPCRPHRSIAIRRPEQAGQQYDHRDDVLIQGKFRPAGLECGVRPDIVSGRLGPHCDIEFRVVLLYVAHSVLLTKLLHY